LPCGETSAVGAACPQGLGGFPAVGNWRTRRDARLYSHDLSLSAIFANLASSQKIASVADKRSKNLSEAKQ